MLLVSTGFLERSIFNIAWLERPMIFAVCFDDRHFELFCTDQS